MRIGIRLGILAGAIAAAAIAAPLAQAPAPHNTLTPAEVKSGWKLLFDGKTIDQWRGFKMETLPAGWIVEEGALVHKPPVRDPQTGTRPRTRDIITNEQYADFDFRFDWQLQPAPPAGNSGVMYYVTLEGGETYHTGPEYAVLDNATHSDGKNVLTTAGACHSLYAPPRDVTRPVGEWNESRIVVDKGKVEYWLNGVKTAAYDLNSDEWKSKVAASKFKEWPLFALARRGHIALQQHASRVAYRNLKIRTLN